MTIEEKVFAALNGSAELTGQLAKDSQGRSIYHVHSPDAGSYPIVVYTILSDVPAVEADNDEWERRVTIRVHIVTEDGRYGNIGVAVVKALKAIGCARLQAQEFWDDGKKVKMIDFRIGVSGKDDD